MKKLMKHIKKFNISEGIEFVGTNYEIDMGEKIWGSDIDDSVREIFQEFYDLVYERFTEIRFSSSRGKAGQRIAIQFAYNNIFHKIPLDRVSDVMIKAWTELGQSIKTFQNMHHCKLVVIDTEDPSPQELYSINWKVKLIFEKNI